MLGSLGPRGSCSNTNIRCCSSYKCLCILCTALHCIGQDLHSLSEQSGKSTPQCQLQSIPPYSANRNSRPAMLFQCYLVNYPSPPSLPLELMLRGSRPHYTTCYMVVTGFLHPVEPHIPLPAGHPADYANYIPILLTAPVVSLLSHVHTVPWTYGRKEGAKRLEENARSHRNCRCIYSVLDGTAAIVADIT